jgi:hypothetical protein
MKATGVKKEIHEIFLGKLKDLYMIAMDTGNINKREIFLLDLKE